MIESHRVAVIGAGPIGIELAVALKQAGVDYVHFDAAQIGATIQWYPIEMLFHSSADRLSLAGVPIQVSDQQKPKREEYLAYLRSVVMQFGLQIRTYERVENVRRLPEGGFLLDTRAVDGPHAVRVELVVLAIGAMHAPRTCGIPGEELPHVSHYFFDPHTYFGRRLLIIGGRNSAVETAVRCQRAGAQVTLSYRGADFDPKSVKFWLLPEIRAMIRDGKVRFLPRTIPIEIRGGSALLAGDDGTAMEVGADFVLLMTGYRQDTTLFDLLGVELRGSAREPVHDPDTMETNVPGVYIAGTAVAGTPPRKVSVIVETCHVHVPRIVAAITDRRVALPDGLLDD
ncbi:MAG TPA: NAD(P)-binding domain-containing protein [Thermoanaerobaculia bacterium]|nr:NAD(P)-binding domain-containing protein [Thermoanaerobaculia bacterium]